MKTTSLLVTLLYAAAASANIGFGLSVGAPNSKQEPLPSDSDDLAVPGENPLQFCAKPDDDILTIESVDLDPNPPAAGKTLIVTATGTLKERVEDGAKVHLQVKYGLITLINQEADLCDQIKNVDLDCPLEKGKTVFKKDIDLPAQIPPGKYTVLADVFTADGDKITCLTAQVWFNKPGGHKIELF